MISHLHLDEVVGLPRVPSQATSDEVGKNESSLVLVSLTLQHGHLT